MKRGWLLLALVLIGCERDPIERRRSDNPEVAVDFLLTIEGCRVYRFWDVGLPRYVTVCGQRSDASWSETHGAGKSQHIVSQRIETVTR